MPSARDSGGPAPSAARAGAPSILVAVAWPYANGPLHLGHVAGSLLPPDIFARYHRLRGRDVTMLSGSDMHGTPITVAAEKAGIPPEEFAAKNHALHKEALVALGIHFDLFTSTATPNHRATVHEVFEALQKAGYIDVRSMTAPFDVKARRFLPDRYIEGTCPHCGAKDARGDQCDNCGRTLDPQELIDPRSKLTNERPEWRETQHFFLLLSKLEGKLRTWSGAQAAEAGWRSTVANFTNQWLTDGLRDRAITRDLTYGVPLPAGHAEFEEKRIYVWFEAVVGYLSATREWAALQGNPDSWKRFWQADGVATSHGSARAYYFLGKDNIPFHTIIWPAMLIGANEGHDGNEPLLLPWNVPANEFLQFKGAKFSKSKGNAFYVLDLLQTFRPDHVRYYLCANMPEKGDTDWTWEDFAAKVNDELVGTFGNYVHRVLSFCERNFGGIPPDGRTLAIPPGAGDADIEKRFVLPAYDRLTEAAEFLETPDFKKALKALFAVAQLGNQSIDAVAPWALVKQGEEGKRRAARALRQHLVVIGDLAVALAPFLPHASAAITAQLGEAAPTVRAKERSERAELGYDAWPCAPRPLAASGKLGKIDPLFTKIDAKEIATMFSDKQEAPGANAPVKPSSGIPATPVPSSPTTKTATAGTPAAQGPKGPVAIEDFQKLDLRVGIVRSVEDHPKADKLYVLKVDIGAETRQIVAGLRALVPREKLLGSRVVIIANLKPAVLRGVESQGMLLAAEDSEGHVVPLTPAGDVDAGAHIR
ncbi:MAG: methionine--tRNA ligase [Thermoplasmatota archaeon]